MTRKSDAADGDDDPEDRPEPSVRRRWDESRRPSLAVAEAVADALGRDPTASTPIQSVVDADALDALLTSGPSDHLCVSFEYAGADVVVRGDGLLKVRPLHAETAQGTDTRGALDPESDGNTTGDDH